MSLTICAVLHIISLIKMRHDIRNLSPKSITEAREIQNSLRKRIGIEPLRRADRLSRCMKAG
jgi:predicted Holliday junction resolvase-like endonuclease